RPVDALDVGGEDPVEVGFIDLEQRLVPVRYARVVDHDVEPSVELVGGREQVPDVRAPAHVAMREVRLATCFEDGAGHPLAAVPVDVVDQHPRALGGEAGGDTLAEARS